MVRNISLGILVYIILMSIADVFAVLSNFLAIYCIVRFKKLRTATNVFICNLAVSDILLAGFVMPQKIHDITHDGEDFYEGKIRFLTFIFILLEVYFTATKLTHSYLETRKRVMCKQCRPRSDAT